MAIGKPRGKHGMVGLYIYDPAVKRKRWVGVYASREDAEEVEREILELGRRNCRRCRRKFQPLHAEQWMCSEACVALFKPRARRRTRYREDDHWVYTVRDDAGEIIYVGITSTGLRRNREHGREMEWWPLVRHIEVDHYATREEALAAEAEGIRQHQPRFNTLGIVRKEAA